MANEKIIKILPVLLFIILCIGTGWGAEQGENPEPAPPRQHQKRFYIDKEGNLYAARELPVYLHISSTPDNREAIPLQGKNVPPAPPLPFLTEGLNVLKRTGPALPKDTPGSESSGIGFPIYGDGTPPVTTATFANAPSYEKEGNMYYGKGVVLELTARDALSGVQGTYLSINGKAFEPRQDPFSDFPPDREIHVRYYSVDNVGNAEKPGETVFFLDVSPPRSRLQVNGKHEGLILSPGCVISLSAADRRSGVKSVFYKLDEKKEAVYKQGIPIRQLAEGSHTLVYYSGDHVGNVEEADTYTFYYDKSAPSVSISIVGPRHQKDGFVFVSGDSQVKLEAADNKAGTEAILYRLGSGQEQVYAEPFPLPRQSGIHKISYSAVDRVDNRGEKQTGRFYLDLTAPETEYEISGYFTAKQNELILRKDVEISLASADLEAGVKELRYRVNEGETTIYTGPLSFETDGEYKLTYYAVDGVNNREEKKELLLRVDNSLQATGFHLSSAKYPKQWYTNDRGELIGSTALPFYLVLSTTEKEMAAGMHLLLDLKKFSRETGEPITFKKGGINYLHLSKGPGDKGAELFRVHIDALPPVTRPVFSGAQSHVQGKDLYFGPGLILNFAGEDNKKGIVSGYRQTFVSLDDSPFFTFTAPLNVFSREKVYNCRYYSVDNVGNSEAVRENTFTVDTTPPVTNWQVSGMSAGRILSAHSVITLSTVDNLSGVKAIYYRFGKQKEKKYRGQLAAGELGRLPEGEHHLFYYAVDNTGNKEEPHELSFYLDHASPAVTLKIYGNQHKEGNILYVSRHSRIGLSASDRRTSVKAIRYQIDEGKITQYSAPFQLPRESGRQTICYCSVDGVGNISSKQSRVIIPDNTPPETKVKLNGPVFANRFRSFASPRTTIELIARDSQSGLKAIYYQIDRQPVKEYTRPFRITAPGSHTIAYHAADRVDNKEPSKKMTVYVDKDPPKLEINYNVIPRKDPKSGVLIFPANFLVSLSAQDKHTEVDKIMYRLDKGKEYLYRHPLSGFETGKVITLHVFAVDRLGNSVEAAVSFRVEKK